MQYSYPVYHKILSYNLFANLLFVNSLLLVNSNIVINYY